MGSKKSVFTQPPTIVNEARYLLWSIVPESERAGLTNGTPSTYGDACDLAQSIAKRISSAENSDSIHELSLFRVKALLESA